MSTIEARLRRLEDVETIRRLIADIARGVDRYDGPLLASAIHDEAVLDMGGGKTIAGAAFAAALKPPVVPPSGRMHLVSNERIDVSGDSARSESHIVSCQDVIVDGVRTTRIRAGRYLDQWERHGGQWKLSARTLVDEWSRIDGVGEAVPPGAHRGRPAPDDPSYLI